MDSQTIVYTPAQMEHFADELEESLRRIRNQGRRLEEAVTAARAVWRDEKYESFRMQLGNCIGDLAKFDGSGSRFVDYLRQKAALGYKYLNRR